MIKPVIPSMFIGLPAQLSVVQLEKDYITIIKNFFQKINKPNAIILMTPYWQTPNLLLITAKANDQLKLSKSSNGPISNKHPLRGSSDVAGQIKKLLEENHINSELEYAHEIESSIIAVLTVLYPEIDVPIIELSLPIPRMPQFLLDVGHALASLRRENVLILGMGNIVYNSHEMAIDKNAALREWALEFDAWVRMKLTEFDRDSIREYKRFGPFVDKAVPNSENYDPFLFIYGTLYGNDELIDLYSGFQYGTISLRSIAFGSPEHFRT